jgi:RNA 2',3'-cyclic 3'-phosphodiesterase
MRVFAGLPIPEDLIRDLMRAIDFIRDNHRNMSFVKPAGMHITLHFFGDLGESQVKSLIEVMKDPALLVRKIKSKTGRIGRFPKRGNPRVLFVGLDEGMEELRNINRIYHEAIGRLGYVEEEREEFVPHITLARNKGERIDDAFLQRVSVEPKSFFFDRLVLFQSILSPQGAVYEPLETVMFR